MGSVFCKPSDAARMNRQIDCELRKDEVEQRKKLKILLLGTQDSGKSTIVKQMRLIHGGGFNDTEMINAIFQIRMNVVDAFKQISLIVLDSPDIEVDSSEKPLIELFAYNVMKIELMQESDELNLLNSIRFYSCIKEYFRIFKTHPLVPDNIYYFFPELHRVLLPNYTPSITDLLHMRVTTLSVHEISFDYRKYTLRLIDVGGQKTERRKWIHFFEGVTAVMFVTSLACFDQFVEDDQKPMVWESFPNKIENRVLVRASSKATDGQKMMNRLTDSIQSFISVQQNNFLHKSSFMLFLNKKDILSKKLNKVQFSDYYPGYETWFQPDNTPESVSEYIESMFRRGATGNQKIYSHFTIAIETQNIEYVFNSACDVIFNRVLQDTELE